MYVCDSRIYTNHTQESKNSHNWLKQSELMLIRFLSIIYTGLTGLSLNFLGFFHLESRTTKCRKNNFFWLHTIVVLKTKLGKKVDEILIYDPFRPTIPLCIDFRTKGTSINDVRRFENPLPPTYIVRRFYSVTSRYFEAILTPLPTLKLDVINGCSANR